jgi:hypothetical protein
MSLRSSPLFYLDTADQNTNEELTFFVQPKLIETPVSQQQGWAIRPSYQNSQILAPTYWSGIVLTPQVPVRNHLIPPDSDSIFKYQPKADWLTDDSAAFSFGTSVIGRTGRSVSNGIKAKGLKIGGGFGIGPT